MNQYQAGYLLDSVREDLVHYSKYSNKGGELCGLLRQLNTYNIGLTLLSDLGTV